MRRAFQELVSGGQLTIVERIDVPPRQERRAAVPEGFTEGVIGKWLRASIAADGSLWRHQSLALAEIDEGSNVVVATSAASGKSLIFQAAVFKEFLQGEGKAIVLYPLKALLADQLSRWKRIASDLGFPDGTVAELHGQILADERMEAIRNASRSRH
jgi:DEAD/DEAH box helicase domain-containing protein